MSRQFGARIPGHPRDHSHEDLRNLLSTHGVIVFESNQLSTEEQKQAMMAFGPVQSFFAQQAPRSYADPDDVTIINLSNDDFLGRSRMGWHMDQTYLFEPYLPVRSLYCESVGGPSSTEFADVAVLSDRILEMFPGSESILARYSIDLARKTGVSSIRPIFSRCDHVGRLLIRYDNRATVVNVEDPEIIMKTCRLLLESGEIPRFSVEWKPHDFVIFDNNQCPHRRAVMGDHCHLKRITSTFWLNRSAIAAMERRGS